MTDLQHKSITSWKGIVLFHKQTLTVQSECCTVTGNLQSRQKVSGNWCVVHCGGSNLAQWIWNETVTDNYEVRVLRSVGGCSHSISKALVSQFLDRAMSSVFDWPYQSADLSPTEQVGHLLKPKTSKKRRKLLHSLTERHRGRACSSNQRHRTSDLESLFDFRSTVLH